VLAVAAVLALEWAAPYADVSLGDEGHCLVEPDITAVAGLLRLGPERAERLRLAGRSALQIQESEIHLVETSEGTWGLTEELDPWSAAGLALEAATFVASTPVGHALSEILNITRMDDHRAVELLQNSQTWASEQIDQVIRQIATENPRRVADLLASLSTEVEALSDTHSVLKARYQADIELMERNR
ncbi:MAG: hypothetical protein VYC75_06485, partial [Actinomycetota bacterium]|nr:hypothetical protein [Actinomycetota bacterium]